MTTEIDALMDLDPCSLSDRNIDELIAWHRKNRAKYEAGGKPDKTGPKIDLAALGLVKAAPVIKRRF